MSTGTYERTPEGLTYKGRQVLVRGENGMVAIIDEPSTDQALLGGFEFDAQWKVLDQCGCIVGSIRDLHVDRVYEVLAYGPADELSMRTRSFDSVFRWISDHESACEFRYPQRSPRRRRESPRDDALPM